MAPRAPLTPPTGKNITRYAQNISPLQDLNLNKDENGEEKCQKTHETTCKPRKLGHSPTKDLRAPPVTTKPSSATNTPRYAQKKSSMITIHTDPPVGGTTEREVRNMNKTDSSTHMANNIMTTF
jgi:hypothetical protein